MKNIQKFKLTIIGTMALILTVGLNVRHALNNYGILDNPLHMEILAQSNTSGKGSGSGSGSGGNTTGGSNNNGGSNIYHYEHLQGEPKSCSIDVYVDAAGNAYANETGAGVGVKLTKKTVDGMKETCPKSGSGCTVYSCHATTNTGSGT